MVEIIPKAIPKIPVFLNVLFYISIVALVFSLIAFFVLNNSIESSKAKFTELNSSLTATVGDAERISLEEQVFKYQDKINMFSIVFAGHKTASSIFSLIQKNTHLNVWFRSFTLDVLNNSLTLTGQAKDFKSLGQQMLVLKQEEDFREVELSNLSISNEGKVDFNLLISVNPAIF